MINDTSLGYFSGIKLKISRLWSDFLNQSASPHPVHTQRERGGAVDYSSLRILPLFLNSWGCSLMNVANECRESISNFVLCSIWFSKTHVCQTIVLRRLGAHLTADKCIVVVFIETLFRWQRGNDMTSGRIWIYKQDLISEDKELAFHPTLWAIL